MSAYNNNVGYTGVFDRANYVTIQLSDWWLHTAFIHLSCVYATFDLEFKIGIINVEIRNKLLSLWRYVETFVLSVYMGYISCTIYRHLMCKILTQHWEKR